MGMVRADAGLVNAIIASHVTVKSLWMRYRSLGGSRTRQELQTYLTGEGRWSEGENALLIFAQGQSATRGQQKRGQQRRGPQRPGECH
jgi:hypothetical protein